MQCKLTSLLGASLPRQEPLLPSAPGDSGLVAPPAMQNGHAAAEGLRGPRGIGAQRMARPRSIAGSMYTLARSMRIFPTALSPHRCGPLGS
jgi:hypothetical protein